MKSFSVGRAKISLLTRNESAAHRWDPRARARTVIATPDRWALLHACNDAHRAWRRSTHFVVATPSMGRRAVKKARARRLAMYAFGDPMEALRVALASTGGRVELSISSRANVVARFLTWRNERMPGDGPVWQATRLLMRRDSEFRSIISLSGPPQLGAAPFGFASIARSIVFQQLSGRAASTIWARVVDQMPDSRMTPRGVGATSTATFRSAGVSGAKIAALKDLAKHVTTGQLRLRTLRQKSNEDIVKALTAVRGIGPWSAQMQLMFALGRLDVWPVLDLGVRKGLARLHGIQTPADKDAEAMGDRFRPYRSLGAWAMWRLTEMHAWPYNSGCVHKTQSE